MFRRYCDLTPAVVASAFFVAFFRWASFLSLSDCFRSEVGALYRRWLFATPRSVGFNLWLVKDCSGPGWPLFASGSSFSGESRFWCWVGTWFGLALRLFLRFDASWLSRGKLSMLFRFTFYFNFVESEDWLISLSLEILRGMFLATDNDFSGNSWYWPICEFPLLALLPP